MLTPSDLRQPALRLLGIYCLWLFSSFVNLVTLHSAVRLKLHRAGQNPSWVVALVSLQAAAAHRGVVCLSRMAAAIGVMTSTRILVAALSVLSPKPLCPQSLLK